MAQLVNFAYGKVSTTMNTDLLYPEQQVEADFELSFEQLFKAHFKSLHSYAFTIVQEEVMAEEIVQNVFCRLWEKRDRIEISQSAKSYLYRSVHNESLNYLKHLKVRAGYQAHAMRQQDTAVNASDSAVHSELQFQLALALNDLPEQCRTIFQMSRYEELKYREIADKMGLSVKTVENQMGKALRILRGKLADFLVAFLFSFLTL